MFPGQFYCKHTQKCHVTSAPCAPVIHYGDIQYKVLLPIDSLESKKVIMSPADNVAITAVQSCGCTGALQYYTPTTNVWKTESNITRQNALILGKDNSLRYERNRLLNILKSPG